MSIKAPASSSKPRSHRVILREAEPVHIEAERGLDARDVKHGACDQSVLASMLLRLPRALRQLATRGTTGLLWTLAFADLAAVGLDGRTFATG